MKKTRFAQELILDLYDCQLEIISSKKKIQEFVNRLCRLIRMKQYGRLRIERFGGGTPFGEGYSFCQFIETSSITGHFLEVDQIAFINIFSCRAFNDQKVIQFAKQFFQAQHYKKKLILRR